MSEFAKRFWLDKSRFTLNESKTMKNFHVHLVCPYRPDNLKTTHMFPNPTDCTHVSYPLYSPFPLHVQSFVSARAKWDMLHVQHLFVAHATSVRCSCEGPFARAKLRAGKKTGNHAAVSTFAGRSVAIGLRILVSSLQILKLDRWSGSKPVFPENPLCQFL